MTFSNQKINDMFDLFLDAAGGDINIVEDAIAAVLNQNPDRDYLLPNDVLEYIQFLTNNNQVAING